MNPSSNETSGLQLPAPVAAEQLSAAESAPVAVPEQAPVHAEQAPVPVAPPLMPMPPAAAMPLPMPAAPTAAPAASPTANDGNATTDDADLIEKEWVERAKRVIEQTRDDPYKQSEELTVVKADYMKRNYDKVIKLDR